MNTLLLSTALIAVGLTAGIAQAEVVEPGCMTDGLGSRYAPSRVVNEDGKSCSAYTIEEGVKLINERRKKDDNRNTIVEEPETEEPVAPMEPETPEVEDSVD